MINIISRFLRNSITATFLAGLLVLLPIVLTVAIIAWIADFLKGALGPGTFFGDLLTFGGRSIGADNEALAFVLGIAIALVGIWLLGVMVRTQARRGIQEAVDTLFTRVPLVRTIYQPVSKLIRMTAGGGKGELAGMSVVSCRFGGEGGADVIALLASRETFMIGGVARRLIFLPSSPVPMTGTLVLVKQESVIPVPDMKVDDLIRLYLSFGTLAADAFPANVLAGVVRPVAPLPSELPGPGPDMPAETRL